MGVHGVKVGPGLGRSGFRGRGKGWWQAISNLGIRIGFANCGLMPCLLPTFLPHIPSYRLGVVQAPPPDPVLPSLRDDFVPVDAPQKTFATIATQPVASKSTKKPPAHDPQNLRLESEVPDERYTGFNHARPTSAGASFMPSWIIFPLRRSLAPVARLDALVVLLMFKCL